MGYKDETMAGDNFIKGKRKNPLDDIISRRAVSEFLGCAVETILEYVKEEGLPFILVGRDYYFSCRSLHKWFLHREATLVPKKKLGGMNKVSSEVKEGAI